MPHSQVISSLPQGPLNQSTRHAFNSDGEVVYLHRKNTKVIIIISRNTVVLSRQIFLFHIIINMYKTHTRCVECIHPIPPLRSATIVEIMR